MKSLIVAVVVLLMSYATVHETAGSRVDEDHLTEMELEVRRDLRIKFAAVIYRHGARTPVSPYPTDPYKNESLWPEKFGQLINTGKMQHYQLGRWLRDRYRELLSQKYNPNEIYIKTTNVDRTIMSAEINTAGLYPPKGGEVWNKDLNWQPIPIHTVADDDEILAMARRCPAYDIEMRKYLRSNEYKTVYQTYQHLLEYVSKWSEANVTDFTRLEYVFSTLSIEQENSFRLPEWTKSVFPESMREPACFSFKVRTATPRLARLKAGSLLNEISQGMVRSLVRENTPRLLVYSGHDNTIADMLSVLRVFDVHCPPFAAAILIELLMDEKMSGMLPVVRISYRNSSESDPVVISVPGCTEEAGDQGLCPLSSFLLLYHNVTDINFDKDCGIEEEREDRTMSVFLDRLFKFVFLFVIVAGLCIWVNGCQKRGRTHLDY